MFTILERTESYVLIQSTEDKKMRAFPIDQFQKAKARKSRDIKRNRVTIYIKCIRHIFSKKEWNASAQRTSYRIIRQNYGIVIDGVHKTCVILGSENNFVIMPADIFEKCQS